MKNRYLLLGLPGALFWVLALVVVLGDFGHRARPLLLPGIGLFVAAVLFGGIAFLRKAPPRQRISVVVVNWSAVVPWIPFFAYSVKAGL